MQFKFYKNSCIFWYLDAEGSRLEKIKREEKNPQKCKCPMRIWAMFCNSGDEVVRVVWWWGRGAACNTCQSPCLGNVKIIDSSLVVTAVPPTGSLTLKLPISKNQNVILALPSPSVSTQHPYPWHPSSHAAVPGSNSLSLFNRLRWRQFPQGFLVLWPVSIGLCDEFLSFSVVNPTLPPPVSDAWTSSFDSETKLLPVAREKKNENRPYQVKIQPLGLWIKQLNKESLPNRKYH